MACLHFGFELNLVFTDWTCFLYAYCMVDACLFVQILFGAIVADGLHVFGGKVFSVVHQHLSDALHCWCVDAF